MQAFLTKVVHVGDTGCCCTRQLDDRSQWKTHKDRRLTAAHEDLVGPVLISKLRGIAFPGFLEARKSAAVVASIMEIGSSERRNRMPVLDCPHQETTHKLDGNLLVVEQVCTLENHTERSLADLLAHSIVHTDHIR